MAIVTGIVDIVFHLDKHLAVIINNFGVWSYLLFFAVIFAETGLVMTPFLPGDSLIFALGAFTAVGSFDIALIFLVLVSAAIIGDSVNYAIGKFAGSAILATHAGFMKKEYLDKTHKFYEKYGAKTIVIARFVPIVRTFAPFVAGVGRMSYRSFFIYNVLGGLLWVSVCLFGGYFFGNIPVVKENFSIAIFVVIFLSILPILIEYAKHRKKRIRTK